MGSRTRLVALAMLASVVVNACSSGAGEDTTERADLSGLAYGVGVTEAPCPETGHPDRGCVYLGSVTDRSGPFAVFGDAVLEGQRRFWQRVNDDGGLGGRLDVDVTTHVADGGYDPEQHARAFRRLEPRVLAFASSLGTDTTVAVAEDARRASALVVPISWWSGWADLPMVLASGSSTCVDAVNGVAGLLSRMDAQLILHVGNPGTFGDDSLAGVAAAVATRPDTGLVAVPLAPVAEGGETDEAVSLILAEDPDLVVLAVGPRALGEIVGRTVQRGFDGRFLAHAPGFIPQLLDTEAGGAIVERVELVAPYPPYGADTPGHAAMRTTAEDGERPPNDGVTVGWVSQYPLLAALRAAEASGDLTRDGLTAAVDAAPVDFEGALPSRAAGESAELVRRTWLLRPGDGPTRLAVVEELETAAAADLDPVTECAPAPTAVPPTADPT